MTTTADDVWKLLAELVEAQKETERCFQETEPVNGAVLSKIW